VALVHGRSEGSSVGNGEKRSFVDEKPHVSGLNNDFVGMSWLLIYIFRETLFSQFR